MLEPAQDVRHGGSIHNSDQQLPSREVKSLAMIELSAFGPKACEFEMISGDSQPTKQGVNIDMTRRRRHLDCSTAYMQYCMVAVESS